MSVRMNVQPSRKTATINKRCTQTHKENVNHIYFGYCAVAATVPGFGNIRSVFFNPLLTPGELFAPPRAASDRRPSSCRKVDEPEVLPQERPVDPAAALETPDQQKDGAAQRANEGVLTRCSSQRRGINL
jgi:hypothetical protein